MSVKIQLSLKFNEDLEKALKKKIKNLYDFRIISQSLDARSANKGRTPKQNYIVEVLEGPKDHFSEFRQEFQQLEHFAQKPIIIGAGPAGLFSALRFSEYGIPCQIFERGSRAHERMKHIAKFWRYGEFNPEDNVCYGEGGAGLFSDGKLITRIKSEHVPYVMQRFVDFGAPPETAYISNPHLGSNKIRGLINKITDHLKEKGCDIHYQTRVDDFIFEEDESGKSVVKGIITSDGKKHFSDHIILATGHSAKEVYHCLQSHSVAMVPKDFALGVRIEHPRKHIDRIQYGKFAEDRYELGAARYRLSHYDKDSQKGTYSFCMCPGGYVLSSGTDADGIVVNGMSNFARNSPWSNSAIVVTVQKGRDFALGESDEDLLDGLLFQQSIEKKAYDMSVKLASGRELPAQRVVDFLNNRVSESLPKSSAPSKIFSANLREIFPESIVTHLCDALKSFDQKMPGFIDSDAILIAPETRTSAPLTIERCREELESLSHRGLYPCGEGAGHAGGITSAAVDGIKVCEAILKKRSLI